MERTDGLLMENPGQVETKFERSCRQSCGSPTVAPEKDAKLIEIHNKLKPLHVITNDALESPGKKQVADSSMTITEELKKSPLPSVKKQKFHDDNKFDMISSPLIENEYEKERQERIKRNQMIIQQLGLPQLAAKAAAVGVAGNTEAIKRRSIAAVPRRRPSKQHTKEHGHRRQSARNRHTTDTATLGAVTNAILENDEEILDGEERLLEQEEYFKLAGIDYSSAIHVDGHYRGWVSPAVAQRYGLPLEYPDDDWLRAAAATATARAPMSCVGGARGRGRKSKGSDAKTKAQASLSYNPNAYFYRHVAPHEKQAQGEWTEEEQEVFMKVVRQWGVGDNWGLFASHIPQRVGYQCSAFYRDVIIPSGLVIDHRFKMQPNGKAIFRQAN